MIDSPPGKHIAAVSRRRATTLAAATAIGAVVAALALTATAEWNPAYILPAAIAGFLTVLLLAIATLRQQQRNARAVAEMETENAALVAAQEEAATANVARARFVADIAHDLRQPLHALGLFLDALERRVTPGEGDAILARTREASGILSRAFNALIDLTRVEADTLIPEIEVFAVDDLLNRLEEEYAAISSSAGLDLRVVHSRANVVSDERLVGHVLRTLLTNALDSGPGRLLLGARHRGDRLWIELHCSSPGKRVSKWDVLNAAEPIRASNRNAEELDLLVVRRLGDLMGMSLSFVGPSDRGIVVALGLPKASERTQLTLRSRSILLVADDAPRRVAYASALASAGALVHVAGNLRQADHALRSNRFELVVTDLSAEEGAARDAHVKLAASVPALPNRTPLEKVISAAEATLKV
jgi:K+-sensing histidine kinase KdpD